MDTGDSKLTAFIDNKYIPMDSKIKLAVAIVVLLIPIVLFFFVFYQPSSADISRLKAESKKKRDEISRLKTTENNLDLFREQTAAEKEKFELAVTKLPSQKEIPQLLKDISALGRNAGLEFLTFAPRPHTERNFYDEIPVDIDVRGPYHAMGYFFDQVSKLDRIVSVKSVRMTKPTKVQGEILLESKCQLLTYRFTNKKLETAADKKKKKKKKK